jgi:hypothetical protein
MVKVSDFNEWKKLSFYKVGVSNGAVHQVSTVLKYFNYGFNFDNLYLKFDFNEKSLEQLSFKMLFLKPIKTKVFLSFKSNNRMASCTMG